MTETGRFLGNHHDPRQTHTRAFGRQQAPLQAMVADDEGRPVAVDTPGELLVRAEGDDPRKGFFSAYLNDPQATQQAWRGGWFHTGDVVRQDATGMLFFVDRKKDMVRRSGENISSAEVEAVLAIHPSVLRVAVLAVADEMRDEEVMAASPTRHWPMNWCATVCRSWPISRRPAGSCFATSCPPRRPTRSRRISFSAARATRPRVRGTAA
jgi:crotonobetaine/carnitine-CoA ligase